MERERLYKGRYMIGIYNSPEDDGDDGLYQIFDNCRQLAEYLGTNLRSAISLVNLSTKRENPRISIDNRRKEIKLIDVTVED